jgi:hypothetical protein
MQHLTLEAIARLVDEAPDPDEAAHLSGCIPCRRELAEMRAQTAALGSLDDPEPDAEAWPRLEAALRAEALILDIPRTRTVPAWRRPSVLRAAAAVAIFLVGGAGGMLLRAGRGTTTSAPLPATTGPVAVARPPADANDARPGSTAPAAPEPTLFTDGAPAATPGARLASTGTTGARPQSARAETPAVRRARAELRKAEDAYLSALQRYAAIADPSSGADDATRLEALDRMVSTTSSALQDAPDDPVINGYHLAALREREALRRELASQRKDWF